MPQKLAGTRTEPPVSEPTAKSTSPPATAAAEPLEEPPGTRSGARVFTGWNLRNFYPNDDDRYSTFRFRSSQHDTDSKTFSFPIYPDGGKTIPARSAGSGQQDGLDLINAVAAHPETGPRLARKLYTFFVSELKTPPESFIQRLAGVYYSSGYDMRAVVGSLLRSAEFQDPANYFARYSWPVT